MIFNRCSSLPPSPVFCISGNSGFGESSVLRPQLAHCTSQCHVPRSSLLISPARLPVALCVMEGLDLGPPGPASTCQGGSIMSNPPPLVCLAGHELGVCPLPFLGLLRGKSRPTALFCFRTKMYSNFPPRKNWPTLSRFELGFGITVQSHNRVC